MDIRLESTSSDYNEELHVILSRGRHQLCTANAIYSFDDLYDNYRRAFKLLKVQQRKVDNILILGLGLGSIPSMLKKKFGLTPHFTAVEIDDEVIYLAQKYVLDDLGANMQIVCADAHSFVLQSTETYDLICMDVFIDDVVPSKFEQQKFLSALNQALGENGILLYNRLSRTREDKTTTKAFFDQAFKSVFTEGEYLDVKGNWMLTNKNWLQGPF